jgi:hypothetical protein
MLCRVLCLFIKIQTYVMLFYIHIRNQNQKFLSLGFCGDKLCWMLKVFHSSKHCSAIFWVNVQMASATFSEMMRNLQHPWKPRLYRNRNIFFLVAVNSSVLLFWKNVQNTCTSPLLNLSMKHAFLHHVILCVIKQLIWCITLYNEENKVLTPLWLNVHNNFLGQKF